MSKLWQKIRHNQGLVISGVLALVAVAWAYGCQVSVRSILHPEQRLTRPELAAEVEAFAAQARLRFANLDRQEELKQAVFNMAIQYAKGGRLNPVAIAITLSSILGLGAVIDNRRKDVCIKTLKNNAANKVA